MVSRSLIWTKSKRHLSILKFARRTQNKSLGKIAKYTWLILKICIIFWYLLTEIDKLLIYWQELWKKEYYRSIIKPISSFSILCYPCACSWENTRKCAVHFSIHQFPLLADTSRQQAKCCKNFEDFMSLKFYCNL